MQGTLLSISGSRVLKPGIADRENMGDRRRERGALHRPHNTLSSTQAPRFTSKERSPQLELFETWNPPSQLVKVNEEWVQSFKARLSRLQQSPIEQLASPASSSAFNSSGHSSRLGDFSSLFSFASPSGQDSLGSLGRRNNDP